MRDDSVKKYNGIFFEGEGKRGTVTVLPMSRFGCARVPSSKSVAHRMLICAALSGTRSELVLDGCSEDVDATAGCLEALGAKIERYAEINKDLVKNADGRAMSFESPEDAYDEIINEIKNRR